eukprot:6199873-Pleurochrysis_carterae.AAC.3
MPLPKYFRTKCWSIIQESETIDVPVSAGVQVGGYLSTASAVSRRALQKQLIPACDSQSRGTAPPPSPRQLYC